MVEQVITGETASNTKRDVAAMLIWKLLISNCVCAVVNCVDLHIGGVFPMEAGSGGWAGGEACLPAVQIALQDVNANTNILPGYMLKLHYHNSKCQPGLAAKQMYELLYKAPTKLMLLAGCSPVTTVFAEAAPVWNLVVLSYGGSSPALSNRQRFPTLFRTHPTANMQNPTRSKFHICIDNVHVFCRLRLFQKFKWKKITILQSVEEVFTSTAKDLEEQCREKGIRVERQSFYGDPSDAVKTLVRQDARIIVGLFYVTEARRVLCQAYKHDLYGRKYVWFFIGWYADTWFIPPTDEPLNCTAEQMIKAAQYHITTESIMLSRDEELTVSGMTGKQFQNRLMSMLTTDPAETGGFPEAPLAYDAVWAVALAFNCTLSKLQVGQSLENFAYNNTSIAKKLFSCVKDTQFRGVSGQVMFNDLGDRIARTQIEQLQDGKYQMLGIYDTTTLHLDWYDKEKFSTMNGLPPPDSTLIQEWLLTVDLELYYAIALLAVIGIFVACIIFIFNVKNSDRMIIMESQPQCNNVLLAGCILCCLSLLLLGLPARGITVPKHSFTLLCHSQISLLMVGFTFAYGSMFAKVWVVHRLGSTENQHLISKPTTGQPVPACKFYLVVTAFFVVDVIIITCWFTFDPIQRVEQRFPLQEPPMGTEEDIMLLPILELCQSLVMGYKCLLLLLGLFLAYETRNLKPLFVNDLRFVGLAIYNVAVLSLITGPIVTFLIRSQSDANFAFISITVLLSTYITLGLIFLPKIVHIRRIPKSGEKNDGTKPLYHPDAAGIEQKRCQQLVHENADLKCQIEHKEKKIADYRQRLGKHIQETTGIPLRERLCGSTSDENITQSFPTALTTTALIENLPSENMAKYNSNYEEVENEDTSSTFSELFL
uniref:Receptor family ligand binding region containing protein n=1 Tax=Wuchereria bancrofti TaxID=6293 RepID=A0A1I8EZ83_WUCBA